MRDGIKDEQAPLVSICVITYNHEKYIKQAVDSILSQKMNFTHEILIADDASTDHTQQILKENYSNIKNVRLILRKRNVGINGYKTYQKARGKYIYLCEGDDYCVGEDSIQTLVDWLESHEEYAGVCGRRIALSERTGLMRYIDNGNQNNKSISLDDILSGNIMVDDCAMLYRNFYSDGKYDYRYYLASRKVSDISRTIYVLLHGNVFQLEKIVGVYRSDRIRGVRSYNTTHTSNMIFEDHMILLLKLNKLIDKNLNFKGLRKRYTRNYVNSLSSPYEFIIKIPYICRIAGMIITLEIIKEKIISMSDKGEI